MWKRRLIFAGLLVVLIAAGLIGWRFYTTLLSDKELRDAIAEADRLDPGWRLEELEAKRAVISAAENSAEQIMLITNAISKSWLPPSFSALPLQDLTPDDDLPPQQQLDPERTAELRQSMETAKESLAKARALMNYHAGRYRVLWSDDYDFMEKQLGSRNASQVMGLLWFDAKLRIQDGDMEGALISVLSILSVARSIGDEPFASSQIKQMDINRAAIYTLERLLAQGNVPASSLANLQHNLEVEVSEPLLLFGLRGERARRHQMMEALENGQLKNPNLPEDYMMFDKSKLKTWFRDASGQTERLRLRIHAAWIRATTEIMEIAKLPVEEQRPQFRSFVRSIIEDRNIPPYVGFLISHETGFADAWWRNQAHLRCTIAALAAEQYRLSHGRWPDSLSSLVPVLLSEVPLDPYDGKRLRYRRLEDGVVIYSVGPDEEDNGGALDRRNFSRDGKNLSKPGMDLGFQLWDVNRRRQPWHPPIKPRDEEDK